MKKVITLAAAVFMMVQANAQKSKIQSAINYLKDKDLAKAKSMIDEATTSEATKGNAKAWLLKAVIYQAIVTPKESMPQLIASVNDTPLIIDLANANELKASTPDAYSQSLEAFKMAMSLDSKYSKEELVPLVANHLFMAYNNGINEMNANQFNESFKSFGNVVELAGVDNGKLFSGKGQIDTIKANAKMYQANSAYLGGKESVAIPLMEECISNPITQKADLFIMLTDLYEKQDNETKWIETVAKAKKLFPSDKRILDNEINYYLRKGKGEESIKKLKEGIAADPKKIDLYIILGQTYYNMANPEKGSKPANAKELEENALANYKKAEELEPNNAFVQFYTGVLLYNQAKETTDIMNKADDKTYEKMLPQRDAMINKSLPYLEKSKSLIDKEGIKEDNKEMYKQVLSGLMQSYNLIKKEDKAAEIKKLLKTL